MKTLEELRLFYVAIPEDRWCKGRFHAAGRRCAVGHLVSHYTITPEIDALLDRLGGVKVLAAANDGPDASARQNTLNLIEERSK